MERLNKAMNPLLKKADAVADIGLINQYSVKELRPEDVFCFSVVLCDNDVDRDNERFPTATLEAMAPLFLGKTGISDHSWSANRQIARLYRVETERTSKTTKLGDTLVQLRGSAYMLRNEKNQPMIDAIEGGIVKEVSVGCAVSKTSCSVCGGAFDIDWNTWQRTCENGHVKGEEYDGKPCVENLEDPTDAYEFSFVAVPAQRGAGVTKSAESPAEAFEILMTADLSECAGFIEKLMPKLRIALQDAAEKSERAEIIRNNKRFLKEEL